MKLNLDIPPLLAMMLLSGALLSCSSNSTGNDDNDPPDPPTPPAVQYDLTVAVDPPEGGSVDPGSGTYDEGTQVTVEAEAAEGWIFDSWSGDRTSESNPFTFTINSDTDLTAHFSEIGSRYEMELTLADSADTMTLQFGQSEAASEDYDEGIDFESPPDPPAGAFHSWFELESGQKLLWDFRNALDSPVVWNLQYMIGSGDSLSLSWSLDETAFNGTLTLRNSSSSFQVDMMTEQQVTLESGARDSLFIEYVAGE